MKYILLILGLLCLCGCSEEEYYKRKEERRIFNSNRYSTRPYGQVDDQYFLYLVVIDNHEYLCLNPPCHGVAMTHKADCKYCESKKSTGVKQ